jgi:hypothetical protein
MSSGQSTAAISAAMRDLNRSGRAVTLQGTLDIAGETVWLRVRRGEVLAVLADKTEIPWSRFRNLLRSRH